MIRLYAYLGAALALVAAIGIGAGLCYRAGQMSERAAAEKAALAFKAKESELLIALEATKQKTKVVYRDRIKIVSDAVGACLDDRIPSDLLGSLRNDVPAD